MRLDDVSSDIASEPVRWPFAASSSAVGEPVATEPVELVSMTSSVSCTRSGEVPA